MDYSVINNIYQYFLDIDFQLIPTDSDQVKMFGSFQKSSLYLVNIIALDDSHRFDRELFEKYKQVTRNQFKNIDSDKVILLNLFLSENTNIMYKDVNYCPETSDDFVDINWMVNTETKSLVIPEKQINALLGLEKNLPRVINNETVMRFTLEEKNKTPIITYVLMSINIIAFIIMERLGSTLDTKDLIDFGALYSGAILIDQAYWRIITSMFIHMGISHIAFNTLALYIFGTRIERYITSFQYLIVYFMSGIIGGLVSITLHMFTNHVIVSAGASAAIYGLVGSIFILSKLTRRHIEGLNAYVIVIYLLVGIVISGMTNSGSVSAHVGGFFAGVLVTLIFSYVELFTQNHNA